MIRNKAAALRRSLVSMVLFFLIVFFCASCKTNVLIKFVDKDGNQIGSGSTDSAETIAATDSVPVEATAAPNTTSAPVVETTVADVTTAAPEVKKITLGQTIVADGFELTINKVEFSYDVLPPDTSSVYSSYQAEAGKVYLNVAGTYKNTSKVNVCIRDLPKGSAEYSDGYFYNGFQIVDNVNRFTWASSYIVAEPLTSCGYHSLIECPQVVESSSDPLKVYIDINGEKYEYTVR